MSTLASWTTLDDPEAQRFAGTARYRVKFDAPAKRADDWELDLGDVRETARVTLNGKRVATAWSLPFKVRLDGLKPRGNVLEIEVTNLPANRIRDLDLRKVTGSIMRDINLVSVKYQPLDASGWEIEPSGLLGPVTLVPLARFNRAEFRPKCRPVAEHAAVHDGEDAGVARLLRGGFVDDAVLQPQRRHVEANRSRRRWRPRVRAGETRRPRRWARRP